MWALITRIWRVVWTWVIQWWPFLTLVALVVVGVTFYAHASNGSKQAEIGVAFISAAGIGAIVAYFGNNIERAQRRGFQDVVQKGPAAPPVHDTDAPRTQAPAGVAEGTGAAFGTHVATATGETLPASSAPHARSYEVRYEGHQLDTSRVDAEQTRLRVFADDGTYFQFFSAIMSGIEANAALNAPGVTRGRFRRAVAEVAGENIREEIRSGRAPLPDPTTAITVFPDPRLVLRRARVTRDAEPEVDEVVITDLYA
jgi:hypothetical protein